MKQKIAPIRLTLYPTEEPYKPNYSELMAELEADKKGFKSKKRERESKAMHPDLYHGFGIFLCQLVFIFL